MFTTDAAGRVRMTRPQRIVVLCAMCYTSLATSAFLFTTDDFRVTRVLQTACVSAVILFPMGYGVPMLFRLVWCTPLFSLSTQLVWCGVVWCGVNNHAFERVPGQSLPISHAREKEIGGSSVVSSNNVGRSWFQTPRISSKGCRPHLSISDSLAIHWYPIQVSWHIIRACLWRVCMCMCKCGTSVMVAG